MNLPVPTVSVDPGPDWATNIDACLSAIDSHNHTNSQGVQIPPSGLDINTDLSFGNNNATNLRTIRFFPQGSAPVGASDLGCLFEVGVDLYYIDGAGNLVRITQSGSVTGATGTITGLPSGTASASYSAGTFTFRGATNTPASMSVGPLIIGAAIVSPHTVTVGAPAALAADYAITLPLALPPSQSALVSDVSGNLDFYSLISGAYTPTITFTFTSGSFTGTTTSTAFQYIRIGNVVSVSGTATFDISASTGSVGFHTNLTLPVATASLSPGGTGSCKVTGGTNSVTQLIRSGTTLVTEVSGLVSTGNVSSNYVTYNFMYHVS